MNQRQKARDLVELAVNERTPEKERIVAAVKAVALIAKYDLLSSPLDLIGASVDSETVQAAGTILGLVTDPQLVRSVKKIAGEIGKRRRR